MPCWKQRYSQAAHLTPLMALVCPVQLLKHWKPQTVRKALEEPSEVQVKKSYHALKVAIEIVPCFARWLEVAELVTL